MLLLVLLLGVVFCVVGVDVVGEGLGMGGEEGKTEGESRRGEDGEGFGKDVGDDLWLEEVRVELVAVRS